MNSLSLKKITSVWIITILSFFVLAIVLGITMRLNQGGNIHLETQKFYDVMTVHGVTMISIWASAGLVGTHYLLQRYVDISTKHSRMAYFTILLGLILLWISGFVGDFHAGWTFLYPLPFHGDWKAWGTPLFLLSLFVLGSGWLNWSMAIMLGILKRYSLKEAFAWQYLQPHHTVETPVIVVVSMVTLMGYVLCILAGVIVIVLFFVEYFTHGTYTSDPLMMKNLTYFFGHTIANEALYLGLGFLFELMPEVSKQPKFKTSRYISIGLNCTFVFLLVAFFHHFYMDFVEPTWLLIIGEFMSYAETVPAMVVTIWAVVMFVHKHPIKWSLTNILFFLGIVGWLIGVIGAVIDATITNNFLLHNTLWVVAHFHTYEILGNVLFQLAFFYWAANEFAGSHPTANKFVTWKIWMFLIGGFGFLLMFYMGGAESIPRRYAVYPDELSIGTMFASIGAAFATIYLLVILWIFYEIIIKCTKVFSRSYASSH